jgi:hypothetical protein
MNETALMPDVFNSTAAHLETLTADDFTPARDSLFYLAFAEDLDIALTLSSVTPLGQAGGEYPGRRPFSLIFTGLAEYKLPQQIYPLRHEALGLLEIFLVPIRETAEERHYEAVFA